MALHIYWTAGWDTWTPYSAQHARHSVSLCCGLSSCGCFCCCFCCYNLLCFERLYLSVAHKRTRQNQPQHNNVCHRKTCRSTKLQHTYDSPYFPLRPQLLPSIHEHHPTTTSHDRVRGYSQNSQFFALHLTSNPAISAFFLSPNHSCTNLRGSRSRQRGSLCGLHVELSSTQNAFAPTRHYMQSNKSRVRQNINYLWRVMITTKHLVLMASSTKVLQHMSLLNQLKWKALSNRHSFPCMLQRMLSLPCYHRVVL